MTSTPDFPEPGVLFRDLTPVFADADALRAVARALVEPFRGDYDVVGGIEARGFILAAAAAALEGTGMLVIRKPGKLPGTTLRRAYDLEYGQAALEVEPQVLPEGSRVLLVDDVLATGGTLGAAAALVTDAGWRLAGMSVAVELTELEGRRRLGAAPAAIIER